MANVIAQSIAALGTVGALIVAVRVYRKQVDDQHRAHASRVVLVIEETSKPGRKPRTGTWTVTNHSDLPVSTVRVMRTAWEGYGTVVRIPFPLATAQQLGPGESIDGPLPGDEDYWVSTISVHFNDAAGRGWARSDEGDLMRRDGMGASWLRHGWEWCRDLLGRLCTRGNA